MNIDYKKKYLELRNILMSSIDKAYQAGYVNGSKEAQADFMQQQAQQAQQQAAAAQEAAMKGGQGGPQDTAQDPMNQATQQAADAQEGQAGSDLEAGIAALEQELGKSEVDKEMILSQLDFLNKSLSRMKEARELKKTAQRISDLKKVKEMKAPMRKSEISVQNTQKKAVNEQQKLVDSILSKWEEEAEDTAETLATSLTKSEELSYADLLESLKKLT